MSAYTIFKRIDDETWKEIAEVESDTPLNALALAVNGGRGPGTSPSNGVGMYMAAHTNCVTYGRALPTRTLAVVEIAKKETNISPTYKVV